MHRCFPKGTAAVFAAVASFVVAASSAFSQDAAVEVKAEPAKAAEAKPAPDQPTPGQPPGDAKPGEAKPGEATPGGEQKPGEQKPTGDKPAEPAAPSVVTRPAKPAFEVDPKELEVKPVDGKVRFNFHGQPWQGVLEWLAGISGLSLDWQELPGDFVNLRTQQEYTLDEARDLLNQHLLARGYTMLRHGEVLTVVKLDKLDPALVPQVEPEDLDERDPHEFVQTIFELDWLPAETAETELKPLLSPKGKLTKLTATNRLHAIDVVANLRAIRDLLAEEQSGRGRERLVRSFKLEYARAEDVKGLLEEFLGIKKENDAMPTDPQQMQMRMQMMQMRQQQQQQQQQQGAAGGATKEPEISIIANPRENEVIAQAPPEEMAVIEQTVELLDAPPDPNASFERELLSMQVFRLTQIDPEALVEMLNEMGGLSPETEITADTKNRSILVNGPLADRFAIKQVIDKLDGADRKFKVIRLRRLPADYVAGTIRFMMGGEEEQDQNDSRRRYYFYDPWGRDEEEESPSGKFRVDADIQNNRLMLYANEIEMEQIQDLLVQLGEVRPDGARSTVRVLNLSDEQATEFLRRLEQTWTADETHPLVIEPTATPERSDEEDGDPFAPETERPRPAAPEEESEPQDEVTVTTSAAPAEPVLLALSDEAPTIGEPGAPEPEAGADAEPNPNPAETDDPFEERPRETTPVTIRRGPDGRLVVTSDDPRALDAVEDMMYELAPPPKDYHVFKLKYPTTYTYWVVLNLEDFFGVGEEEDDGGYRPYFFYADYPSDEEEDPLRLSQRKELKFIADEDSRTILVQGATPEQLKTIEELIEIYDQPQSQNSGDLRVTQLFKIKHAKAETVATAIKDVYRDLLSANDRALQGPNPQGQQQPVAERSYTYVYGGGGDKDQTGPEPPIRFKGLLSIGVDEDSNTLVVSASQSLIDDIGLLIESLDLASKEKEAVSVVRTGGAGVPKNLSGRLKEIFGDKVKIVGEEPTVAPEATSERTERPLR